MAGTETFICNARVHIHDAAVDWIPLCAPTGNQSLLPSLKIKREAEDSGESSSLIVYKGSMVDVESMMQKLEKSEKAREEIEQKLMQQDIKMGNNLICLIFIVYLNLDFSVDSAHCFWLKVNIKNVYFYNSSAYIFLPSIQLNC